MKNDAGDLVTVDELDDTLERDARAILPLRERSDGGLSIAQRDRLVVDIERKQHRDTRAAGPAIWLKIATSANLVDGLVNLFDRPLPTRDDGLLVFCVGRG